MSQTPPDGSCIITTAQAPYTQNSTYNPTVFDWKAHYWDLWLKNESGPNESKTVLSPFFYNSTVFDPNTRHLAQNINGGGETPDFEPNDGWGHFVDIELLVNFVLGFRQVDVREDWREMVST